MSYKRHRIFASGVHRKPDVQDAVWPPERVTAVFQSSIANSPKQIPYTFRHPENGLPVLGYADRDSLEIVDEGGRTYLSVMPKELAGEFIAGLKSAGFDKVSIGLGKKGEVVHIGVTDKPAVTGLGAAFEADTVVPPVYLEEVEFEASVLGDITAAFDVSWKWSLQRWMSDVADLFTRIRESKIETDGLDAADKFLPSYVLDYLKLPLPEDDPAPDSVVPTPTYEATPMTAEEKAKMDRLEAENKRLMTEAANRLDIENRAKVASFCDDLPDVITPAIRPKVESFLLSLIPVAPVTFEDDKGASHEVPAFDFACELLRTGIKPAVVFGEVAGKGTAPDGATFEAGGEDAVQVALRAQYETVKVK